MGARPEAVAARCRSMGALCLVAATLACSPSTRPLVLPEVTGASSRIIAVRTTGELSWRLARAGLSDPLFVVLPEAGGEVMVLDYAEAIAALDLSPCGLLHPLQAQRAAFPGGTEHLLAADFQLSPLPDSLASQLVPLRASCGPGCASFSVEPLTDRQSARVVIPVAPREFLVVFDQARQLAHVDLARDPPIEIVCDAFELGGWRSAWLAPDGVRLFIGDVQGYVLRFDLRAILRDHRCQPEAMARASTTGGAEAIDGGLDARGEVELFTASWVNDVVTVVRLRDLALTASASAPLALLEPSYIRSIVRLGPDQALTTFDGATIAQWDAGTLRPLDVGQPLDQKVESLVRLDDGRVLASVSRHGLYVRSTLGRWTAVGEEVGHERVGVILPEADRWFFSAKAGGLAQWVPGTGYCPTAFLFGDNRFRAASVSAPGELFIADAPLSATPGDSRLVRVLWRDPIR